MPVDAESARRLESYFFRAFQEKPAATFREWYILQERLAGEEPLAALGLLSGDAAERATLSRALTNDLLAKLEMLPFDSSGERARFLHNLGVFLGAPGPSSDLARSRRAFSEALEIWAELGDQEEQARAQHNMANAIQSLAQTAAELYEALELYGAALTFRAKNTTARRIGRAVTLHNQGTALRRLAALEPANAAEHLGRSVAALEEACAIRKAENLREGLALSCFHLGLALKELAGLGDERARVEAVEAFENAARIYDELGKDGEAGVARREGAT